MLPSGPVDDQGDDHVQHRSTSASILCSPCSMQAWDAAAEASRRAARLECNHLSSVWPIQRRRPRLQIRTAGRFPQRLRLTKQLSGRQVLLPHSSAAAGANAVIEIGLSSVGEVRRLQAAFTGDADPAHSVKRPPYVSLSSGRKTEGRA